MKMNRTTFFANVRKSLFGGRLITAQVEGMNAILDAWDRSRMTDPRWLAYMLATAFHETGATMQPVRETFAKSDTAAIAALEKAWKTGKLKGVKTPYWRPNAKGIAHFGRGLPQITHEANYERMGTILGLPLASNPSLALQMPVAIRIMFEGMTKGASLRGDFTGKSLEDYFNATRDDPVGARAIINSTDRAGLIAGYHKSFLEAIKLAIATYVDDGRKDDYIASDVKKEDAKPDDVPVAKSKSLWTIITGIFAGGGFSAFDMFSGGSSILGAINNPWALVALLAFLIAGGFLVWLMATGRLQILRGKAVK